LKDKLSDEEKKTIEEAADDAISWLSENKEADAESIKGKQLENSI
jgi:TRAP-type C4-dicarboxylate transport system substrate-binding protein